MNDHVLSVEDLKVHFGGVHAVDGLTFDVPRGIIQGVIGPNGSGKSTLLGSLSGLTPVTAGRVYFDDREITALRAERTARCGMSRTFQTVRLLPTLDLLENVQLGIDIGTFGTGMWRPWLLPRWSVRRDRRSRDAAHAALAQVGLADSAPRRPGELPYGHQRRVEIARAIVSEPTLVLLDEPAAGMNRAEKEHIARILADLRGAGISQVLIDHDVDMMAGIADDLITLSGGKLLARGKPIDVVRDPVVQDAYLGRRHDHAPR